MQEINFYWNFSKFLSFRLFCLTGWLDALRHFATLFYNVVRPLTLAFPAVQPFPFFVDQFPVYTTYDIYNVVIFVSQKGGKKKGVSCCHERSHKRKELFKFSVIRRSLWSIRAYIYFNSFHYHQGCGNRCSVIASSHEI